MQLTIDIGNEDENVSFERNEDDKRLEELDRMRKTLEFDADEIDENVYVGSLRSTSRVSELEKRNIKHILNLSCRSARSLESYPGVEQLTINILDATHEKIIAKFQMSNEFIEEGLKKGAVLICCSRGISRSVTIGCAWLMYKRQMDYIAALKTIQGVRPIAAPHFSFIGQLYVFQVTGFKVDVEEEVFDKLIKEFTEKTQPQDLFVNELAMSLSMERGEYMSEDEDGSPGGINSTPRPVRGGARPFGRR